MPIVQVTITSPGDGDHVDGGTGIVVVHGNCDPADATASARIVSQGPSGNTYDGVADPDDEAPGDDWCFKFTIAAVDRGVDLSLTVTGTESGYTPGSQTITIQCNP